MPTTVRKAKAADAAECGRIIHAAFAAIAAQHNFPPDFPSAEVATGIASMLIAHPDFYAIVAENDGRILGSNFLDERSPIGGIGPITIDPSVQNKGIGRQLMQAVMERAATQNMLGIRLVQDSFHNRSLCLYARLGFTTREPLSVLQGPALKVQLAGYDVRPATEADLAACNAVCRRVHGFDRGAELKDAIAQKSARLVEHLERITGYATDIGYFAHAVAENNESLKALIGAAPAFAGPGFLLPTRNDDAFRWCLDGGLRLPILHRARSSTAPMSPSAGRPGFLAHASEEHSYGPVEHSFHAPAHPRGRLGLAGPDRLEHLEHERGIHCRPPAACRSPG